MYFYYLSCQKLEQSDLNRIIDNHLTMVGKEAAAINPIGNVDPYLFYEIAPI